MKADGIILFVLGLLILGMVVLGCLQRNTMKAIAALAREQARKCVGGALVDGDIAEPQFSFAWKIRGVPFSYSDPALMQVASNKHFAAINWTAQMRALDELCTLLELFSGECESKKIDWWLGGGAVLGYLRNRSLIPWDDDLDVFLKFDDEPRFAREVVPALRERGCEVVLHHDEVVKIYRAPSCFVWIDVFFKAKMHGNRWVPRYPNGVNHREKKETTPEEHLFPLRPIQIHGIRAYLPHDPVYVVQRQYGVDCLSTFVVDVSHNVNGCVLPKYAP